MSALILITGLFGTIAICGTAFTSPVVGIGTILLLLLFNDRIAALSTNARATENAIFNFVCFDPPAGPVIGNASLIMQIPLPGLLDKPTG